MPDPIEERIARLEAALQEAGIRLPPLGPSPAVDEEEGREDMPATPARADDAGGGVRAPSAGEEQASDAASDAVDARDTVAGPDVQEAPETWIVEDPVPAPARRRSFTLPKWDALPGAGALRGGARPAGDRPASASLEMRLGAEWLPRLGILVFVLGIVFFLKLAADTGLLETMLPAWARAPLGVFAGIALWIVGDRMHGRRYGHYPQVLAAGGAVVVAFSVFAAYHVPVLREALGIGLLLDSVLLGIVIATMTAYAAWRQMRVLASIASVLAPLTAIVAGAWDGFSVAYLTAMTAAAMAVAHHRRWHEVAAIAMPGAFAALAVVSVLGDAPLAVLIAVPVLGALFLLAPAKGRPGWIDVATGPAASLVLMTSLAGGARPEIGVLMATLLGALAIAVGLRRRAYLTAWSGLGSGMVVIAAALAIGIEAWWVLPAAVVLAGLPQWRTGAAWEPLPVTALGLGAMTAVVAVAAAPTGDPRWLTAGFLGALALLTHVALRRSADAGWRRFAATVPLVALVPVMGVLPAAWLLAAGTAWGAAAVLLMPPVALAVLPALALAGWSALPHVAAPWLLAASVATLAAWRADTLGRTVALGSGLVLLVLAAWDAPPQHGTWPWTLLAVLALHAAIGHRIAWPLVRVAPLVAGLALLPAPAVLGAPVVAGIPTTLTATAVAVLAWGAFVLHRAGRHHDAPTAEGATFTAAVVAGTAAWLGAPGWLVVPALVLAMLMAIRPTAGRWDAGPGAVVVGGIAAMMGLTASWGTWRPDLVAGVFVAGAVAAICASGLRAARGVVLLAASTATAAVLLGLLALMASPWAVLAAAPAVGVVLWQRRQAPEAFPYTPLVHVLGPLGLAAALATAAARLPLAWPDALAFATGTWPGLAVLLGGLACLAAAQASAPTWHRAAWAVAAGVLLLAFPPALLDATEAVWAYLAEAAIATAWAWRRGMAWRGGVAAAPALFAFVSLVVIEAGRVASLLQPSADAAWDLTVFLGGTAVLWWQWALARRLGVHDAARWTMVSMATVLPVVYTLATLDGKGVALAWSVEAAALLAYGLARRHQDVRIAGLVLIAIALTRVFFVDLAGADPVLRILVFLGVGAVLLAASFLYVRTRRRMDLPPAAGP